MQLKKRRALIWIFVAIAAALCLLFVFRKDKTLKVAVETVSRHDLVETVTGSGKIHPEMEVKISPEESGEVLNVYVKEGDQVRKGQVLALIKTISARSLLNFSLPMQGTIAPPKETVKHVQVYAPINGVVSALYVKKGEKVAGTGQMLGTEMMRIADMSRMKLDVNISESEIQKIKLGDTAIIEVEAYQDLRFKGLVSSISQSQPGGSGLQQSIASITEQMSSYQVSISLLPESYDSLAKARNGMMPFRSGMSASADIQTQYQRRVLAVPINAVTTREEDDSLESNEDVPLKEYVFVVNDKNEAIQKEVHTSIQDKDHIMITSGLSGGERVIVAPFSDIARTIKDKMRVKIVGRKELYKGKEESGNN